MIKRTLAIIITHFLFMILCSCTLFPGRYTQGDRTFSRAPLSGIALDEDGNPLKAVLITLNNSRKELTDRNGRFIFTDVRRGEHIVTASLEGFECIKETGFSFLDRTELLTLRLISLDSIADSAFDALKEGNFSKADLLLRRCEDAGGCDYAAFLRGMYLYLTDNISDAKALFQEIIDKGIDNSAVRKMLKLCSEN
jgi:hypothetical protein